MEKVVRSIVKWVVYKENCNKLFPFKKGGKTENKDWKCHFCTHFIIVSRCICTKVSLQSLGSKKVVNQTPPKDQLAHKTHFYTFNGIVLKLRMCYATLHLKIYAQSHKCTKTFHGMK